MLLSKCKTTIRGFQLAFMIWWLHNYIWKELTPKVRHPLVNISVSSLVVVVVWCFHVRAVCSIWRERVWPCWASLNRIRHRLLPVQTLGLVLPLFITTRVFGIASHSTILPNTLDRLAKEFYECLLPNTMTGFETRCMYWVRAPITW